MQKKKGKDLTKEDMTKKIGEINNKDRIKAWFPVVISIVALIISIQSNLISENANDISRQAINISEKSLEIDMESLKETKADNVCNEAITIISLYERPLKEYDICFNESIINEAIENATLLRIQGRCRESIDVIHNTTRRIGFPKCFYVRSEATVSFIYIIYIISIIVIVCVLVYLLFPSKNRS